VVVREARPADLLDAHERLDQVVEARGGVVLEHGGAHHELAAVEVDRAEVPVVLRPRVVEVGEVAAVVDDPLRVGVGEPHPVERGVPERRLAVGDVAQLHRSRS
jgi:hypothetical protein